MPPDRRRAPVTQPEPSNVAVATTDPAVASLPHPADTTGRAHCWLCDRVTEAPWPGAALCGRCVADVNAQLDRRRVAELRLPPLGYWAVA